MSWVANRVRAMRHWFPFVSGLKQKKNQTSMEVDRIYSSFQEVESRGRCCKSFLTANGPSDFLPFSDTEDVKKAGFEPVQGRGYQARAASPYVYYIAELESCLSQPLYKVQHTIRSTAVADS